MHTQWNKNILIIPPSFLFKSWHEKICAGNDKKKAFAS